MRVTKRGKDGISRSYECLSATKENNIMPFAATWIKLGTLIVSEIS